MTKYVIVWSTEHASGSLPHVFTNKREAETVAREWKREMVAADPDPKSARREYQWEVIPK